MNSQNALRFALVLALALSRPAAGAAATHIITQSGFTFAPDSLNIAVGDTVEWNWTSGFHTVTNGEGAADPNAGTSFDATFNSTAPIFSFTFVTSGRVPYFCRPHEGLGMKGVLIVEDSSTSAPEGSGVRSSGWAGVKALYR